jgi:hypothetical protein
MRVYNRQQLESKKISELKEIAYGLNVEPCEDQRKKESWIQAILKAMPEKVADVKPQSQNKLEKVGQTENQTAYNAYQDGSFLGLIFRNTDGFWQCGDGKNYSSSADAIEVLKMMFAWSVDRSKTIEVIEERGNEFIVHNTENDHYYVVRPNHPELKERCECSHCYWRGVRCKHQVAVDLHKLLNKPFDEITANEWKLIKTQI